MAVQILPSAPSKKRYKRFATGSAFVSNTGTLTVTGLLFDPKYAYVDSAENVNAYAISAIHIARQQDTQAFLGFGAAVLQTKGFVCNNSSGISSTLSWIASE
jgi:hypothetical protein